MRNNTKRALLIGVNYRGTPDELTGCEHDAHALSHTLRSHLDYRESEIVVMTAEQEVVGGAASNSDGAGSPHVPTRANIEAQLAALLRDARKDENLREIFVSFSGHGVSVKDNGEDEADGRDEAIVPQDYATAGDIRDDQIAEWLRGFPARCRVFMLVDACHSGTVGDLPFAYHHEHTPGRRRRVRYVQRVVINGRVHRRWAIKWAREKGALKIRERRTGDTAPTASVVTLSGCRDPQTSVELPRENDEGERQWGGALTGAFVSAVRSARDANRNVACHALCRQVHESVHKMGATQVPVLCANRRLASAELFMRRREDDSCIA